MKYFCITIIFVISCFTLHARPLPEKVEGEGKRDYWQFLFFYDSITGKGQKEFYLHPFYGSYRNEEKAYYQKSILFPLYYKRGTDTWSRWNVLNLFSGESTAHQDTGKDNDFMISPLIHWGSGDTEKENYTLLFPFYGHNKSKLGQHELKYILWPVYMSWTYKDYSATSVIWPLTLFGSSPTRSDIRILPFYSSKVHEGKYSHKSILWPIVQWGSDDLDKKVPRHYFGVFPFYARKWSEDKSMSAHAVLWPLFTWGSDTKRESYNIHLFWFFYQYEYNKDPYIRKHIIFPFYGHYRFGDAKGEYFNDTEFYFLWVNMQTRSAVMDSDYQMLIPFYYNEHRYFKASGEHDYYLKIWPLFSKTEDTRGNLAMGSLALWPFRADEFERNWSPFWSIWEYRRYENEDRYLSFLFRLVSFYYNEEESHKFILGFETHDTPDEYSFQFLGGFLGYTYRDKPEKENTLHLMWFDL